MSNTTHGSERTNAKLDNEKVTAMRELAAKGWSERKLAFKFGVSKSVVHRVLAGERWRAFERPVSGSV